MTPTGDGRAQSNMQQVSEDVKEIKTDVKALAEIVNKLNVAYLTGHTAVTKDVEALEEKTAENRRLIDSLKNEVKVLKDIVDELMHSNTILKWIVSVAGAAVIVGALGLVWAIITHQIMLVQP